MTKFATDRRFLLRPINLKIRGRTRFLLIPGQRSGQRHLVGPLWLDTEWHSYPEYTPVKYFHIALGNPYTHKRWAFQVWFYVRYGKKRK